MSLKEDIQNLIKGEVKTEGEVLEEYSTDASLFKVRPKVVIFPKDAEDVGAVVQYVEKYKVEKESLSITARSAGTDMSGGPLNESIIMVFTEHMNEFDINEEKRTARVEPGVYYRDFEPETLKYDLLLPTYPASKSIAALGGMIANNGAGEKTLRYGKTADYVEESKVVLRDGNEYTFRKLNMEELEEKKEQENLEGQIYREMHSMLEENYEVIQNAKPNVTKNSAGYALWDVYNKEEGTFDLNRLFSGAQGTLGVMTEAKLRLVKTKAHTRMAVLFLDSLDPVPELINTILPLDPEGLEAFDDETLKLGLRFFPEIAKKTKGQNLFSLLWQFIPEFWIGIKMLGFPKLIILAQFAEDTVEEAEDKMDQLKQQLKEKDLNIHARYLHSEEAAEKYWTIRRESFGLLREHVKGKRTAPFIDDLIVRPEFFPEVLPKVREILEEYNIHETIAGHAGSGNFHIIPLMDLSKEENKKKIPEVSDRIYDLILKYEGSITAEHNDGLIRSPYLKKMYGDDVYNLFVKTKRIFDPENIFNPGKKVHSSLEYAMEHIDHK